MPSAVYRSSKLAVPVRWESDRISKPTWNHGRVRYMARPLGAPQRLRRSSLRWPEVLAPLGVRRRSRSRTWLDDHGWWLGIVEFQPSAGGWLLPERRADVLVAAHRSSDLGRQGAAGRVLPGPATRSASSGPSARCTASVSETPDALRYHVLSGPPGRRVQREMRNDLRDERRWHSALQLEVAALGMRAGFAAALETPSRARRPERCDLAAGRGVGSGRDVRHPACDLRC